MLCGTTLVAPPARNHSKRNNGREPAAPTHLRMADFGRLLRGDIHAPQHCLAPSGSSLDSRWALFVPISAENIELFAVLRVVIPAELQIFKLFLLLGREGLEAARGVGILPGRGRGGTHALLD